MAKKIFLGKKYAKIAAKVEKLITKNLTLNKVALAILSRTSGIPIEELEEVALRVIKQYRDKYEDLRDEGEKAKDAREEAQNDGKLMVQRVGMLFQASELEAVKHNYRGKKYRWLPSGAREPRPEHQLLYGTIRTVGVGLMPGEEPGCDCGMEILD